MSDVDFVRRELAYRNAAPLTDGEVRLVERLSTEGKRALGLVNAVLDARKGARPSRGPGRPRKDSDDPVRGVELGVWPRLEVEALTKGVGNCIMAGAVSPAMGSRMIERLRRALAERYAKGVRFNAQD